MRRITRIIIHCSASDYAFQDAKWIDEIHRRERGFDKIGYTYFIKFSGLIETGRFIEEVGAHTVGHNNTSIGICLAGEFAFQKAQFHSLFLLLCLLKNSFPSSSLFEHCELNSGKTCPNFSIDPIRKIWNEKSDHGLKFSQLKEIPGVGGRIYSLK